MFQEGNTCYVLASAERACCYIGQTKHPEVRMTTEYRDAVYNRDKNIILRPLNIGQRSRRADIMGRIGVHEFAWIPLARIGNIASTADVLHIEKFLIKKYSPTMNNDAWSRHHRKNQRFFQQEFMKHHDPRHRRRRRKTTSSSRSPRRARAPPAPRDDELALTSFIQYTSGASFHSLYQHLKERANAGLNSTRIAWNRGRAAVDTVANLRREFGTSVVRITVVNDDGPTTYSGFFGSRIKLLREFATGTIVFEDIKRAALRHAMPSKQLTRIATKPTVAKRFARTATFDHLVTAHMSALNLHRKHAFVIAKVADVSKRALKKRWGPDTKLPNALVVKIPFHPAIQLRRLRESARAILDATPLAPLLRAYYKRPGGLNIVFTARPSVGRILHNHIRAARDLAFGNATPPTCCCDSIDPHGLLPRIQGHLAFKATETENTPLAALHQCTTNIPKPSGLDLARELNASICAFAKHLRVAVNPRLSRREFNAITAKNRNGRQMPIFQHGGASPALAPNGETTRTRLATTTQDTRNALLKLGMGKTSVENILRKLNGVHTAEYRPRQDDRRRAPSTRHDHGVPSLRAIQNIKKKYGDKLIFAPLDKNTGCTFICCPHILKKDMEKTFLLDTEHYEKVDMTLDVLRGKVEKLHASLPIVSKQHWGVSMKAFSGLPYAYTLVKDKDITRNRPLISYRKHPYRKMLNFVSRAISFITSTIQVKHCNLEKCTDLKERLERFQSIATAKYGDDARFVYMMGDIKNMYTELRHDVILKALNWAITTFKSQHRRRSILSGPRFGRKGIYIGRTTLSDEIQISLEEIKKVVKFDLDHPIFELGKDTILKQKIGIPMGSPLSAALAPLVCIYFEHLFFDSRTEYTSIADLETGIRYMDDQIAIAAYKRDDVHSLEEATDFVERLAECYDEKMIMENEASNFTIACPLAIDRTIEVSETSNFKFLEATIFVDRHKIYLKHYNKNRDTLVSEKKQKYFRYHHADSFSPPNQRVGAILETLIRMSRYSSQKSDLVDSIKLSFDEFRTLDYSNHTLIRALNKLLRKDPREWICVRPLLTTLRR